MQIHLSEVHIWSASLAISTAKRRAMLGLLTEPEVRRAERFHFPVHQTRFIAARGYLRQILSKYIRKDPNRIEIAYSEHNKPYLIEQNPLSLQFNLAHSSDLAVYAFTLNQDIGVDLEKVQEKYNPGVATRYFSEEENTALAKLPASQRHIGFYRIWARKEALIKAIGKGLSYPLKSFSVSCQAENERVNLEGRNWSIISLSIHPDFEASLATNQKIEKLSYFQIDSKED